jgi:hypothetical protein
MCWDVAFERVAIVDVGNFGEWRGSVRLALRSSPNDRIFDSKFP